MTMQPAWPSFAELYAATGESATAIDWLANRGRWARHYRAKWVPKRHGRRLLEAPLQRLKHVQRTILRCVLQPAQPHRCTMGFVRGRGVIDHASVHANRGSVVSMDLKDFFASITFVRVRGVFRMLGFTGELAGVLALLTTHASQLVGAGSCSRQERRLYGDRHLPQGAPTSPALANLVSGRLDRRLCALAASIRGSYSRYADDLVVSHDGRLPWLVPAIGAIAMQEGFQVQFRKTRVMAASARQMVTGLVVNQRPSVSRAARKALEALLFNCVRYGPASQDRKGMGRHFRQHLQGRIAYVGQVAPQHAARLTRLYGRINWEG